MASLIERVLNSLKSRVIRRRLMVATAICAVAIGPLVRASEEAGAESAGHGISYSILWIAVILLAAKLASLVERFGQPSVLGELVMGVILGNLALIGLNVFEPIKEDVIIEFLAHLGVIILLFQIGLESNIHKMRQVGIPALLVAVIGVVLPFVLGTFVIGPWLLPKLASAIPAGVDPFNVYLFLGATLTATSVGITARVFKDLGKLQTPESRIVLGAAVIDDVMGLIILAVVSAIIVAGSVSVGAVSWIAGKAILFLVGSIIVGQLFAPHLGKLFSKIHTGVAMKFTLVISFGLIFAFLAEVVGLAAIVGAFAAGLILDPVHFKYFKDPKIVDDMKDVALKCDPNLKAEIEKAVAPHAHRHIEDLIEPLGHFLVPIFFIVTGMAVKLETLTDLPVLMVALAVTAAAFVGKVASGLAAGRVRKSIVGWGMVPRGEVGLIFATIGLQIGVVTDSVFSVIVIMVILTTLLTPPILAYLLKREPKKQAESNTVTA